MPEGRAANQPFAVATSSPPIGAPLPGDGLGQAPRIREPLFTVSNHHTAACGEPPDVDGDAAGTYVGYFANEYGEQAV